jgi:hypothetical protein
LRLDLTDLEFVGHEEEEGEGSHPSRLFGVILFEYVEVGLGSADFNVVGFEFASDLFDVFETIHEQSLLKVPHYTVTVDVRNGTINFTCGHPVVHLGASYFIWDHDLLASRF